MSEDLENEIEAIRAIYDERTIRQTPEQNIYILSIPNNAVSVRLQFPSTYPDDAPQTRGVESTGASTRKGYGSHVLGLVDEALDSVFQPGAVCLFDLVQELDACLSRGDDSAAAAAAAAQDEGQRTGNTVGEQPDLRPRDTPLPSSSSSSSSSSPLPPNGPPASPAPPTWHTSHPLTEKKSTFLARATAVHCPADVRHAIAHLRSTDKKTARATHVMTAYRIRNAAITYQDCDDDGEAAAGARLLHLLRLMDVWDVLVVVGRWYGGVKLGPDRFRMINQVAREAVVRLREKSTATAA